MRTRIITIITLLLSTPMVIAQKSMDEIEVLRQICLLYTSDAADD